MRSPDPDTDDVRHGSDRRDQPTPWLSRYTLWGRRLRIRRENDLERGRYVDRAQGPYLGAVILLVVLVLVDAVSTLFILAHGGTEENPLMQSILERGRGWFLAVKLLPLPLAYLLLSVARYVGWVRWGMRILLAVYGALAAYHLVLLSRILLQ